MRGDTKKINLVQVLLRPFGAVSTPSYFIPKLLKMKKAAFGLSAIILLAVLFTACKKDKDKSSGGNVPAKRGTVSYYMTDYYPDSFYHNYANLTISSDSANFYVKLDGINEFKLKKIKLLIGTFDHINEVIGPYTTPPLSDVGPRSSDYSKEYATNPPDTYTFTIPRSSIKGNNFYVYAWAYVERYHADGSLSDWHGSWPRTEQKINPDAATSYIRYEFD